MVDCCKIIDIIKRIRCAPEDPWTPNVGVKIICTYGTYYPSNQTHTNTHRRVRTHTTHIHKKIEFLAHKPVKLRQVHLFCPYH